MSFILLEYMSFVLFIFSTTNEAQILRPNTCYKTLLYIFKMSYILCVCVYIHICSSTYHRISITIFCKTLIIL